MQLVDRAFAKIKDMVGKRSKDFRGVYDNALLCGYLQKASSSSRVPKSPRRAEKKERGSLEGEAEAGLGEVYGLQPKPGASAGLHRWSCIRALAMAAIALAGAMCIMLVLVAVAPTRTPFSSFPDNSQALVADWGQQQHRQQHQLIARTGSGQRQLQSATTLLARVWMVVHLGDPALWESLVHSCLSNVMRAVVGWKKPAHAGHEDRLRLVVTMHPHDGDKDKMEAVDNARKSIKALFPKAVILTVENFGMDIAPFLQSLQAISKIQKDEEIARVLKSWELEREVKARARLDVILKVHTKSQEAWREKMFNGTCDNTLSVRKTLDVFRKSPQVGMAGAKEFCLFVDGRNEQLIRDYYGPRLNINTSFYDVYEQKFKPPSKACEFDYNTYIYNRANPSLAAFVADTRAKDPNFEPRAWAQQHWMAHGVTEKLLYCPEMIRHYRSINFPRFIAGSVFWVRAQPLLHLIDNVINVEDLLEPMRTEVGYVTDFNSPKYTHCWERLWSMIIREPHLTGGGEMETACLEGNAANKKSLGMVRAQNKAREGA